MTLRKIFEDKNETGSLIARVYRDVEWNEFRVRFFRDGKHQIAADYHTDDKLDALSTADRFAHGVAV